MNDETKENTRLVNVLEKVAISALFLIVLKRHCFHVT